MAKRANGEGSMRKRSDGRWEARYYSPIDNKQHSIYGKTQKAVKEKLNAIQIDFDSYRDLRGEDMRMKDWLNVWLEKYNGNIKQGSYSVYKSAIRSRLCPHIGHLRMRELTTETVQDMYLSMLQDGVTAKTIKNVHGVLHKSLEQALKLQYIRKNVSDACVLPRIEKREIQPLDDDQIREFLIQIKGDLCERIFHVALFTGMRQSEILGLTWDAIDFNNGIIRINKQLLRSRDSSGAYFGSPKNGKERIVYMPHHVKDILSAQKDEQDLFRMAAGDKWVYDIAPWKNMVFTDEIGNPIKHRTVHNHYKSIVRQMGLDYSRFHDLRHSFAVISLENGDDIKTVQEALGHHTASFTLQQYAHATYNMRKNSAGRMDKFIENL